MSALPNNALTLWEQRENASRKAVYNLLIWSFCIGAALMAIVMFGIAAFDEGVRVGRDVEKARQAATAKPAPDCRAWFKHCAREEVNSWRAPGQWRKP